MLNTHLWIVEYLEKLKDDLTDIENIRDMFKYCNSLNGVKVKNIPNNNKTKFEQVTGLSSSQYTVVS